MFNAFSDSLLDCLSEFTQQKSYGCVCPRGEGAFIPLGLCPLPMKLVVQKDLSFRIFFSGRSDDWAWPLV